MASAQRTTPLRDEQRTRQQMYSSQMKEVAINPRDFSATPEETQHRIEHLESEFEKLGFKANTYVSISDLQHKLDSRSNKGVFDHGVMEQLIEKVDVQVEKQEVDREEFIKVYVHAEEFLAQKMAQSKAYLQNYDEQSQQTKEMLSTVSVKERINEYGICTDSELSFLIGSASLSQEFFSDASIRTYIQIKCANQTQKTPVRMANNPTYSFSSTFAIESGDEKVIFSLMNATTNENMGEFEIDVCELKNQNQFESDVQLKSDFFSERIVGTLRVSLRWIHSKKKYFEDILAKWKDLAAAQKQDFDDYQKYYSVLQTAFPQPQNRRSYRQPSNPSRNSANNHMRASTQSPNKIFQDHMFLSNNKERTNRVMASPSFAKTTATIAVSSAGPIQDEGDLEGGDPQTSSWQEKLFSGANLPSTLSTQELCNKMTIALLIASVLISFERSMYFDIMIAFKYFSCIWIDKFTAQTFKMLLIAVIISFVAFDLIWIINYSRIWFGSNTPDITILRLIDIISILFFLFKIGLFATYAIEFDNYRKREESQNRLSASRVSSQSPLGQQTDTQNRNRQQNGQRFTSK